MVRPLVDELIDDIVEQLASSLALGRDPMAEVAFNNALLARDTLETDRAIEREELESFARDHPVAEPYDPDDGKERDQF
jgi:hypothetical protein